MVEDALREAFARYNTEHQECEEPVALPVFRGSPLVPGVDLDDSAGLLEIME